MKTNKIKLGEYVEFDPPSFFSAPEDINFGIVLKIEQVAETYPRFIDINIGGLRSVIARRDLGKCRRLTIDEALLLRLEQ